MSSGCPIEPHCTEWTAGAIQFYPAYSAPSIFSYPRFDKGLTVYGYMVTPLGEIEGEVFGERFEASVIGRDAPRSKYRYLQIDSFPQVFGRDMIDCN